MNAQNSIAILSPEPGVVAGSPDWNRARQLVQIATLHECRSLIAKIMAGLELIALQKKYQIKPGQPKKESSQNVTILFKQLIESELHISHATGYRWMSLARAAKKKLEGISLPPAVQAALTGQSVSSTPQDTAQLVKFLGDVTAGKTQTSLLATSTRSPKRPVTKAALPANVASITETPAQDATGKSTPARRLLNDYTHAFPRDADLRAEIETLERVIQLCRQWLMTELGQRDIAVLRTQFVALRDAA